jgi:DNA ligase (NAD+)
MRALEREIARHDELYHKYARPEVSDAEFDALFTELRALEEAHPGLASPDSPTLRVGNDLVNDLPEAEHTIPVLSLDKCYSGADIAAWIAKTARADGQALSFVLEEKLDGASIVLYYEDGILTRAVTRGNGRIGNDVTANARTIRGIPLALARPVTLAVRGEIFMRRENFARYNESAGGVYVNPRNLAAGTLRSVRSSAVAHVPLEFFAYEGFFEDSALDRHSAILAELAALGFPINPASGLYSEDASLQAWARETFPEWRVGDPAAIMQAVGDAQAARANLAYDIDGLVLKVNEIEARVRLGYTAHHPRWAIAYKFESPQAVTRLLSITVQVGRNGRITPVAELEPVAVSGSTIARATLHNEDYIRQLELAAGDMVAISRRGDVIPAVDRVIEKAETAEGALVWTMPPACPCCGTGLVQRGAHHFCLNRDCCDRLVGRLAHFAGKAGLDIEGLGGKTLLLAFEKDLVRHPSDIFTADWTRLVDMDGFGEKRVANIMQGIEAARSRPFAQVLSALGFESIGPSLAELLINAGFTSAAKIIERAREGDWEVFAATEGLAEQSARQIVHEFSDPRNLAELEALARAGLCMENAENKGAEYAQSMQGQRWCVTGSFEHYNPRDLAMDEVKKRGGAVISGVSSKTTHLLAGTGAGSKLQKAKDLGVRIVREDEFMEML